MIDWEKYYNQYQNDPSVTSIRNGEHAYASAVIIAKLAPKTVVLGGFAAALSLTDFEEFSRRHFPNAKTLALDLNPQPLKDARRSKLTTPLIQADLANLPLRDASVDVLMLDYTLNCMNKETRSDVFTSAARVLRPEGAILAALIDTPRTPRLVRAIKKFQWRDGPYDFTNPEDIFRETRQFKPTILVEQSSSRLLEFESSVAVLVKRD